MNAVGGTCGIFSYSRGILVLLRDTPKKQ